MADFAELIFEIDSSQARGAAKALAELNSAAIKAAGGAAKFERTLRDTGGRFQSNQKYLEDNRREIESLAMAYNPAMAAQIKYRDESIRTAAAVKAGVINEQERIAILGRTRQALDASAAAAARFGRSQEVATHHVSNLSFQLNDIGMMMAVGQNPFMLMMQQGPQVAQILGQMNQEGRKLGPALAGAFKMFLNPTTLVTLALIGGAAALFQWASGALTAEKETRSLADIMGDLSSSVDAHTAAVNRAKMPVRELIGEYGLLAGIAKDALSNMSDVTAFRAMENLTAAVRENVAAVTELRTFSDASLLGQSETVRVLRDDYGLVGDEVRRVREGIVAFSEAQGNVARVAAAADLSREMKAAYGSIQQMPPEMANLYENLQNVVTQGGIIVNQTDDWASSLSSVLGYINAVGQAINNIAGGGINIAAIRVERQVLEETGNLQRAAIAGARERARLESKEIVAGMNIQNGIMRKGYEFALNAAKQLEISESESLAVLQEQTRERERAANRGGSGGGGGGGGGGGSGGGSGAAIARQAAAELKAAEKAFQSIRELLEKESIFQVAEWEKRQAQLDAALAKQLLSQEQYEIMKGQLRTNYFGTEYEQRQLQYDMELEQLKAALDKQIITRQEYDARMRQQQWEQVSRLGKIRDSGAAYELNQLAGQFGEAAAMAGDYNEKFLRAQRIFAASASLISTYQGAAKALELPFPMNIAAAAKVLAAGLGFVSAIKGGGSGGGGGASAATPVTKSEPTRYVTVNLTGDDWIVNMVEPMLEQIYNASKDGRVIIRRDR